MDRHNGVGVSGEEIKPCGAKALRMCSISIVRGRLLSQSKPNGMQMLSILTVCWRAVSTFLERIYYDYDNYAGPGVLEAILSRCSTTIFIFIDRYLASYKPLHTRSQCIAAARGNGASRLILGACCPLE